MVRGLVAAAIKLVLGVLLGLVLLEVILRSNTALLIRGMAAPAPLELPLTSQQYTVRYSDADAIFWRPDLIRPISPEDDQIEAVVKLATDEFGFRNPSPLPATVDVVVLGRSTSLGAQAPAPWPELLAEKLSWRVLNLSQPGGGIRTKTGYYDVFGRPRQPRWLILEVVPRIDFDENETSRPVIQDLPVLLVQGILRRTLTLPRNTELADPVYPLQIEVPGGTVGLTCCLHYMDFFSLDAAAIEASRAWLDYRQAVLRLVERVRASGTCVALVYAPSKEEVYFSLALNPQQLAPAVDAVVSLQSDQHGNLRPAPDKLLDPWTVQANAPAGRTVVADFAQQTGLIMIDPTDRMQDAVRQGIDPFMVYDSHWSAVGHDIIARVAAERLQSQPCP